MIQASKELSTCPECHMYSHRVGAIDKGWGNVEEEYRCIHCGCAFQVLITVLAPGIHLDKERPDQSKGLPIEKKLELAEKDAEFQAHRAKSEKIARDIWERKANERHKELKQMEDVIDEVRIILNNCKRKTV